MSKYKFDMFDKTFVLSMKEKGFSDNGEFVQPLKEIDNHLIVKLTTHRFELKPNEYEKIC